MNRCDNLSGFNLITVPEPKKALLSENSIPKRLFRIAQSLLQRSFLRSFLNESNSAEQNLIQDLPDAVFIQIDGRFAYINPAGIRLFGASSADELVGKRILERVHPDWHSAIQERMDTLTNHPEATFPRLNAKFLHVNGSSFHVDVTISPTRYTGMNATIVLVHDISEQVQSRQMLEKYRILTEKARDIMWFVRLSDGKIFEANSAAEKAYGYTQKEFEELSIQNIRAVETLNNLDTQIDQAASQGLTFETVHIRKSGEKFPVEVSAQGISIDNEKYLLSIIRDITERKRAEEQMQKQMEENAQRTNELEAMTEVSFAMRSVNTRMQMVPLLVEQAVRVTKAHSGALILLNENSLVIRAASGSYAEHLGRRIINRENILWDVIRSGQLKVFTNNQLPSYTSIGGLFPNFTNGLKSIAFAPLKAGPITIGLLVLGFDDFNPIQVNLTRLINAIAEMAGSALHRMSTTEMMEKIVNDRTRELEHIYQVSSPASTATDLKKALQQALDQTLQAIGVEAGLIYLLNEERQYLDLVAQKGVPQELNEKIGKQDVENSIAGWVVQHKESLILPDLTTDPRASSFITTGEILSFAGLPMRVQNRVVGMLGIIKPGRERFNLEEMMLLSFIADHIGLVVDHFRLYQQVEKSAVLEERSRMARELHDSVTQSLYSASLFASGALKYVELGQLEKTQDVLLQLGQVTQQALKEMRLMVYELRASALRSNGLVGALQNRIDAVERRSGIKASITANSLLQLPEKLEEDLYRIALEALNNALKHADASQVDLEIDQTEETIHLSIRDNGRGFLQTEADQSGGVGLSSMSERASRWGGTLNIISDIGAGCEIVVAIPAISNDERAA